MGWLFGFEWRTCAIIKDHIRKDIASDPTATLVAERSTKYGKHFWTVVKLDRPSGVYTTVILFKLDYSKRDDCWGYKDISESMGPVELDCPVSLLDMCSEPVGEYTGPWRERVRKLAAARKVKHEIGARVVMQGTWFLVVGKRKRSVLIRRVSGDDWTPHGDTWRVNPARLKPYTPPAEAAEGDSP
jgi:hypothetical protein